MMNDNLLHTVKNTIAKYNMIVPGQTVVVGVSGGADSMVLLHVLLQLQQEWNIALTVAHMNHLLREEESDRDQRFVEEICKAWGISCEIRREEIAAHAFASGRGVEETARSFRYAWFHQVASEINGHPYGKIATAHTADDNAETVLLNLTRGTGVTGLSGISPAGNIIRPLIECSRRMVEEYCERHQIPYVTDSTNLQDAYRRNRIRHHVIPVLKEQNPAFLDAITRMCRANRRDSEFLLQLGKDLLKQSRREQGLDIAVLRQGNEVPLTYAVKVWLRSLGLDESAYHIEKIKRLINKGNGKCSLAGSREVQASGGLLRMVIPEPKTIDFSYRIKKESGVYCLLDKPVTVMVTEVQNVHNSVTYNQLDCDTIGTTLVFRNRRGGDSITLPGRPRKSLKKLLNELKIPEWERSRLLVLADENGVLWVEGVGCDLRAAVTDQTKRVLTITE